MFCHLGRPVKLASADGGKCRSGVVAGISTGSTSAFSPFSAAFKSCNHIALRTAARAAPAIGSYSGTGFAGVLDLR